jgi:hypothetical protein
MGNTIRGFTHRTVEWLERAERTEQRTEGHRCYAYQQADIWESLRSRVEKAFRNNAH